MLLRLWTIALTVEIVADLLIVIVTGGDSRRRQMCCLVGKPTGAAVLSVVRVKAFLGVVRNKDRYWSSAGQVSCRGRKTSQQSGMCSVYCPAVVHCIDAV